MPMGNGKRENDISSEADMLNTRVLAAIVVSVIAFCCVAISVEDSSQLPNMLAPQFDALGMRMTAEGKEKTVYDGVLTDAAGNTSQAKVTIQSGMVKLEGFKSTGSVIAFDGTQATGISGRADESTIESFLMDIPESILAKAGKTASVRLLGRNFVPDPLVAPDYTGPQYDIYDATMPIVYKTAATMRPKQFFFDADTQLLAKTEYYDRSVTPAIKMETRFSVWGTIEGSAYPARIDHYENDALVFSFIATSIEGGPAIDASNFR
jgi:hypothetical protein